jgi:hypothetical protein
MELAAHPYRNWLFIAAITRVMVIATELRPKSQKIGFVDFRLVDCVGHSVPLITNP